MEYDGNVPPLVISLSKIMSDLHIIATKSKLSRIIKADPNIIKNSIHW